MLSFKYDRSKIEELIGRPKMGFGEVLWEGSSLLKEMRENAINSGRAEGLAQGVEEGRAKGIEQGLEQGIEQGVQQGIQQGMQQGIVKGQAEEARRLLRAVLADRFPGTETMLEIDHIAEASALESLLVDRF